MGNALDNLSTICAMVCNRIFSTFSASWYSVMTMVFWNSSYAMKMYAFL